MVFLYFLSVAFADFCFNKDFSITKDTMGERKLSVCRTNREVTYKTINMVKKSSTSDLQYVII